MLVFSCIARATDRKCYLSCSLPLSSLSLPPLLSLFNRLSFDKEASIAKARKFIDLYQQVLPCAIHYCRQYIAILCVFLRLE